MSGAHGVYMGKIPGDPQEPLRFGDLLVDMALTKRGGLVVGLCRPNGRQYINPPKEHVVQPGDLLLYLSEKPLLEPPG